MRSLPLAVLGVLICACTASRDEQFFPSQLRMPAPRSELRLEIRTPGDLDLTGWETSIAVEGGASVFGGVRFLDLMLALDTSKSLLRTDPKNYRTSGAIGLVESLPANADVQIGLVDFDRKADLVSPLTTDGPAISRALRSLDRLGSTNLAAGIRAALAELESHARPDSSRAILLFTDGKTNADKARRAMEEARAQQVPIHALLLGSNREGAEILREIALGTGGSFIHVTDPESLPDAFLNLRTTGVESVTLRVNDSLPVPARLIGGTFSARLPLELGENRIEVMATSLDGRTATEAVTVTVSGPMEVAIETPIAGTQFRSQEREVTIEGAVDSLVDLPAGVPVDDASWGVESVVLRVNDSPPFATELSGGRFRGRVLLEAGENRVAAVARSHDGRMAGDSIDVVVRSPGCAELRVMAVSDGRPALSISDRSVEIVFDASNSMWGQLDGRTKLDIARETLREALDWLPRDLMLALRVYGHRHARELRRCTDSELLVAFGSDSRERIREAIASLKPRGQTPLAYSLEQVIGDFGSFRGERAVILITDGIESCGGDPSGAAGALQERGSLPVHVIGFGLGSEGDEDLASLRAIAEASGGRFLTARSAAELREALAVTVGTSFRVLRGDRVVAKGALGDRGAMLLPAGDYQVRLESAPPHEVPVTLTSEEALTLVLERELGAVTGSVERRSADYAPCDDAGPLEVREQREPRAPASLSPGD